jgi:rhamnosyltransferase
VRARLRDSIQTSSRDELILENAPTPAASIASDTAIPLPAVNTICAIVVTYYPDSGFADRMERVAKQVSQIVIVDNRSEGESARRIQEVVQRFGIHLILNASNEGIAPALNAGVRWAESQGYRWVLTLDQDTLVEADMVSSLAQVFRSNPFPQQAAVIGSNSRDQFGKVTSSDEPAGSAARK